MASSVRAKDLIFPVVYHVPSWRPGDHSFVLESLGTGWTEIFVAFYEDASFLASCRTITCVCGHFKGGISSAVGLDWPSLLRLPYRQLP